MRKSFAVFLLVFVTTSLSAQINFSIAGKIMDNTTKEITISYERQKISVPVLSNGSFSFSGKLKNPSDATVIFGKDEEDQIWLDSGKVEIIVEKVIENDTSSKKLFKITSVKGPGTSESYFKISKLRNELYKNVDDIDNPIVRTHPVYKNLYSSIDDFVIKYPGLELSIDFIRHFGLNFIEKELLFNKVDKSYNTNDIEDLANDIEREKRLAPGNTIDDFLMAKYDGGVFQLSQVQSKYVLLEFWSSRCVPCRAVRPRLAGIYKTYYEKGLEIVGISLDDNKTDWIKAIEKDNVPWIEISDLMGFKNSVASKCKINAIPFWILIDKNRKIIQSGIWTVPESTLKKLMP